MNLFVSLDIVGAALFYLAQDRIVVGADVEGAAMVIEDAVEGIAGNELEVVLAAASGSLPDFIEDPRGGDDSGAAVKSVAVDVVDVGAAAQLVALFEQFDLVAAGGEARGGAQTAEPGADNDDLRHRCPPIVAAGVVAAQNTDPRSNFSGSMTRNGRELRTLSKDG